MTKSTLIFRHFAQRLRFLLPPTLLITPGSLSGTQLNLHILQSANLLNFPSLFISITWIHLFPFTNSYTPLSVIYISHHPISFPCVVMITYPRITDAHHSRYIYMQPLYGASHRISPFKNSSIFHSAPIPVSAHLSEHPAHPVLSSLCHHPSRKDVSPTNLTSKLTRTFLVLFHLLP